ncbi:MAG: hypothetical protein GKR91_08825 [Pseudomonadales bacterium]|nr:hypothetical protein [Pseudomonadales bacterium]
MKIFVRSKQFVFLSYIFLLSILFLFGKLSLAAELEKEFLNSSETFSQVATVSANGIKTIYVSGQVGIRNGEVPDSFAEQVDIVFANMASQLEAAGASMTDVIKLTGFIVNIDGERLAAYSEARARHFSADDPPPASTLIGVSGLVFPALQVEVEAIAVIKE